MRHLMSPLDFNLDELDQVLDLANDIEKNPEKLRAAYEEGRKTAIRQREALSEFLGQKAGD